MQILGRWVDSRCGRLHGATAWHIAYEIDSCRAQERDYNTLTDRWGEDSSRRVSHARPLDIDGCDTSSSATCATGPRSLPCPEARDLDPRYGGCDRWTGGRRRLLSKQQQPRLYVARAPRCGAHPGRGRTDSVPGGLLSPGLLARHASSLDVARARPSPIRTSRVIALLFQLVRPARFRMARGASWRLIGDSSEGKKMDHGPMRGPCTVIFLSRKLRAAPREAQMAARPDDPRGARANGGWLHHVRRDTHECPRPGLQVPGRLPRIR
jgi:hypothetical protein